MLDYDAEVLTLDLFRRQESRTLLDTRLGENRLVAAPKAVDEIIDRCGGPPLTLAALRS